MKEKNYYYEIKVKIHYIDENGKTKTTSKIILVKESGIESANEMAYNFMEYDYKNEFKNINYEIQGISLSKISVIIQ